MKHKINNSPTAPVPELEEIDMASLVQAFDTNGIDIVCVLGPTASGKTHYAVSLARTMNSLKGKAFAEIISADSRQVYKGMDIGSGKDIQEYGEIPYHLIDIVEAGCKYNIYEYQRDFESAYKEIREQGRLPILCGGSGLYMRTAVDAYSLTDVEPDPGLREKLEKTDIGELRRRLSDMNVAEPSDNENRKRLARALEIAYYARDHKVNFSDF
jgi:tRNA dimethylallyltransferase